MNQQKKAVVFINLGSPDSSKVSHVRSYLKEFLGDPCIMDIPPVFRYLLVNLIIAPFRSFRSAKLYSKLANERGFPLIYHSQDLIDKLKPFLEEEVDVYLAMRYGNPSLAQLLSRLSDSGYHTLLCIPLFPQYASSTTGSIIRILKKVLKNSSLYQNTRLYLQFHQTAGFSGIWQRKISRYDPGDYDAIVFSYHGIPVRHTEKAHPGMDCGELNCEKEYHNRNRFCYRAACFQTTRSISERLDVEPERIHTSFQSRFGKNWLAPFTDETLVGLAERGSKKVLVVSPSFVADCLETEIEIGMEYQSLFRKSGGKELTLVPSLNADSEWVEFLVELIRNTDGQSINLGEVKLSCNTEPGK